MCGITGIVDFSHPILESDVVQMRDAMVHRGPDSCGVYLNPSQHAALGHRRLAIIDLSPSGHQPMHNEAGTITIIFNGEIYNFLELKAELINRGHIFASDSDTEVIIHGYEEWGIEVISRLNGMFAIALLDSREKSPRLLLVRDRLGVKPLYYSLHGQRLVFASEAHALYGARTLGYDDLNWIALDSYLAFGYVPTQLSFVKGVDKVQPGQIVDFTEDGLHKSFYWSIPKPVPDYTISKSETVDRVDHLLQAAVERRLMSDVPLGVFLSGGIDSGLVTAIAATKSAKPINTFSVGFKGGTDERALAALVAAKYETHHTELIIDGDLTRSLPALIWRCGEPFADPSILPTFAISQTARQYITVALGGDGGDESFAGYSNIVAGYWSDRLMRYVPSSLLHPLRSILGQVDHLHPSLRRASTLMRYSLVPIPQLYDFVDAWDTVDRDYLLSKSRNCMMPSQALKLVEYLESRVDTSSRTERQQYIDYHLRLAGDYLTKVDIASNAASLEVRSPFLDYTLVEYAAGIPLKLKMLNGQQKGLLRDLAARYLPPNLLQQPKRGFSTNLKSLLGDSWRKIIQEYVEKGIATRGDLFNDKYICAVVAEDDSGQADHTHRLWVLVCLEVWFRLYIDRTLQPNQPLLS